MTVVRIDGINALEKSFRELSAGMQGKQGFPKNLLRNSVRAAANVIKEEAKTRVHVSQDGSFVGEGSKKEHVAPGRMKRSVTLKLPPISERDFYTSRGDSLEAYDIGYYRGRSRDDPKGAWYAGFEELGTARTPAHPVLRPALHTKAKAAFNKMQDKLGKDILRLARKLEARNRIK